jgi:flavin-dependent dehydrogenase
VSALVIGGGPAGCAAAYALARGGAPVTLIEREAVPGHKVCGEFLSFEAQDVLRGMGIDAFALGAAPIERLRVVHGGRTAETVLPFRAAGLSRPVMDTAMQRAAGEAGASIHRVAVRRVDGATVEIDGGERLAPQRLLLASGKTDLRGAARDRAGTEDDLVGFKLHYRLAPGEVARLAGHIEVLLFRGGYAGLQPIEGGAANLCLLVTRERFAEAGRAWSSLIAALADDCPHLGRRLDGAVQLLDAPLAIANVPYGFLYRPQAADLAGLYRAGDQLAVIPSFSGDGMAIAMHSGRAAALAMLAGEDGRAFHAAQAAALRGQIRFAAALQRLGRPSALHPAMLTAMRLWPGLMRRIAMWTRVPPETRRTAALCPTRASLPTSRTAAASVPAPARP